jgi:hypothetical protein
MSRQRIALSLPLSESDLAEALRLHDATGVEVVCRPRASTILPPPPDTLYSLRSVPPQPVETLSVAPSLPTLRPGKAAR